MYAAHMVKLLYKGPALLELHGTETDIIVYLFGDDAAPLAGWRGTAAPAEGDWSFLRTVTGQECRLHIPGAGQTNISGGTLVGNRRIAITGTARYPEKQAGEEKEASAEGGSSVNPPSS